MKTTVTGRLDAPAAIVEELRRCGAAAECHVISVDGDLDGTAGILEDVIPTVHASR